MKTARRGPLETASIVTMKGIVKTLYPLFFGIALATLCAVDRAGAQDEAATGPSAKPAEIAQLPYQALVGIARNNADRPEDGEKMMLRISSSEGVGVEDIKLTIMRAEGEVPIVIDENGDFEVPFSDELYDENPMVASNQPKGTMNLKVMIDLKEVRPKVVDGKVKYRDLFSQVLELQKKMRGLDPNFGTPGYETLAIQIVTGGEPVVIMRKLGSREIAADEEKTVWMVYDLLLFEENPDVKIPEKAEVSIKPVDARTAVAFRAN